MGRKKDESIQIKVCILNKQHSSINFSIRIDKGVTKEEASKQIVEFLNGIL